MLVNPKFGNSSRTNTGLGTLVMVLAVAVAGQGVTRQGMAGQRRAGQGRAGHGKAGRPGRPGRQVKAGRFCSYKIIFHSGKSLMA
jgi:hypothetical protein